MLVNECGCGFYPTVIVPGIGQSKVELYSVSGEKIKKVWPLSVNEKELLKGVAPAFIAMLLTRRDEKFLKALKAELVKIIAPFSLNSEGVPKHNLRPVDYRGGSVADCTEDEKRYIYKMVPMKPLSEVIGEDHLFFFSYNSFGQPYETAAALHRYIQNVKKLTGHNKVNLVPVSLGASITTAYFDAFGKNADIHRVCYFVPAANGSSMISDIFSDNLSLDDPESIFEMLVGKGTAEKLMKGFGLLPEGCVEKTLRVILGTVKEELLLNCPGMWAVVPREEFTELCERYLSGSAHSMLRAKAERFYKAQNNLEKLLKEQEKRGVQFFSVCGYGMELLPFCKSRKTNSDTIVDFKSASLGGTAAPIGERLTDISGQYISPDFTVDLSTAIFPESTFCFKNQVHDYAGSNDTAISLAKEILTNEQFRGIKSDSRFPQFSTV